MTAVADRQLLFGLLALQIGLINQGQLVAAFQAWTLDKSRSLADHLEARGDLDAEDRAAVEALLARHLKRHGGDVEKSLTEIPAGQSTRESLARIGDDPPADHRPLCRRARRPRRLRRDARAAGGYRRRRGRRQPGGARPVQFDAR